MHGQSSFIRDVGITPNGFVVMGSTVAPNGNILLCGYSGTGWLDSRGAVVCLDPTGNTLWSLVVDGTGPNNAGIGSVDYPEIVFSEIAWATDHICVAGGRGAYEVNGNQYMVFASLVLDTLGNVLEAKATPVVHPHAATHVRPYGANEVLRGYFAYGNFGTSFLLSRGPAYPTANTFDSRTWSFPAGPLYQNCSLFDMAVLQNGNCAALGGQIQTFNGSNVLAMHNDTLGEVWNVTFTATGLSSPTGRIAGTPNGGLVIAMAETEVRAGYEPVHLLRYSTTGALEWSRVLEWPADARIAGVHVRNNGKIMVAGGLWNEGPADSTQLWLMQADTTGNVDWIQHYGDLGIVKPLGFHPTPSGNGYVLTTREGLVLSVDTLGQLGSCAIPGTAPGIAPLTLGPAPTSNVYLFASGVGYDWLWYPTADQVSSNTTCIQPLGLNPTYEIAALTLSPNPFTTSAKLMCPRTALSLTKVELVDLHGRVVRTLQGNGTREVIIDRGDLASGIYTVRVIDADGLAATARLVVQ
jgi:hypothetical protein